MAKTEKYFCDQCGKEKGEVNHWFVVIDDQKVFGMQPMGIKITLSLEQEMFNPKHVCGQNCASILLARWMSTVSLDAPKNS